MELSARVPSLQSLCAKQVARNVERAPSTYLLNVSVPAADEVLACLFKSGRLTDRALQCFSPLNFGVTGPMREQTVDEHEGAPVARMQGAFAHPISRFNLRQSRVSDRGIASIAYHPIHTLDLTDCSMVTGAVFESLRPCAHTLTTLRLSNCIVIEPWDFAGLEGDGTPSESIRGLGTFVKLTDLDLSGTRVDEGGLRAIPQNVEVLNLSRTKTDTDVLHAGLAHLHRLRSLDVSESDITYERRGRDMSDGWTFFQKHSTLRCIDISACDRLLHSDDDAPELHAEMRLAFFERMCCNQELTWVNLSLLELDGLCFEHVLRLPRLQFLGAYRTNLLEEEIPEGLQVAAHFNKKQVICALQELGQNNLRVVREILKSLFRLLSPPDNMGHSPAITTDSGLTDLVIRSMMNFAGNTSVQCYATANLFYLTRLSAIQAQSQETRLLALQTLLEMLRDLIELDALAPIQVVKNCCLTLRNFQPEGELSRCSCSIAITLLRAALTFSDSTVQHVALLMCCHNLASLHPRHKERIGAAEPNGGIELVIHIIKVQHTSLAPTDDAAKFIVLELCWTFLWNITDETPNNVARFLDLGGIELFLHSLTQYPEMVALRRNVMGLVTNISEVPAYRHHLLEEHVLEQLQICMSKDRDNLEVTYNVAGTLCHIMAEGEAYWFDNGLSTAQRKSLLSSIADVVAGWNKATERWINYRSLKPIVALLRPGLDHEVYIWSTWALLSLCTVTRDKYCAMCSEEGALEKLRWISRDASLPPDVRANAGETIQICDSYLVDVKI